MLPTHPGCKKAPPPQPTDVMDLQKGYPAAAGREAAVSAATVDVCLAAAALAGAALLTWWAHAFHRTYAHLWMVPVGLVLACTPVVVCAALHFSPDPCVPTEHGGGKGAACWTPQPMHALVFDG